jgi:hypothetical protein
MRLRQPDAGRGGKTYYRAPRVEGRDPGSWTAVGGMPSWSRSRTNDWSS